MIQVKLIPYTAVRECGADLLAEYSEECAWPDMGPPNPQWDIYAAMEAAGVLLGLAVYAPLEHPLDDLRMVGFASVIISILPHYGVKVATVESMFVGKAYRSKGAGSQLMAGIKSAAAFAGCKKLFYSATAGSQLEKLLEKRHTRTNSIFCESLG